MTAHPSAPAGLLGATTGTVDHAQERKLVERLRDETRHRLASRSALETLAPGDREDEIRAVMAEVWHEEVQRRLRDGQPLPAPTDAERIQRAHRDAVLGLGGIQPWLDDPSVENIIVNGPERAFVVFEGGRKVRVPPVCSSNEELAELVRTTASRWGTEERRFDRASPTVDLELPDGSRLVAVMGVTREVCLTIRRHRLKMVTLDELRERGEFGLRTQLLLRAIVRAKFNTLISGGTDTGKTTLLRAMAGEIAPEERLLTVEDTRELGFDEDPRHPDTVAMQTRLPNIEGKGGIDATELVRCGLRFSPDRVMVGEVRGSEVVQMFNCMCQGNDGSMATIHASTSLAALSKLVAYAGQGPQGLPEATTNLLIGNAVHFIVQLDKDRDGVRIVSSIREICGTDGSRVVSNEVFAPGPDGRAVPAAPLRAATACRLAEFGYRAEDFEAADDYLLSGGGAR